MADYDCWPLWHHGGRVGNIEPKEVGVTDELASKLSVWAAEYDAHLNRADPAATSWAAAEEVAFERRGKALCRELAQEVGERYDIFYSSRCIDSAADSQLHVCVADRAAREGSANDG